MSIELLSVLVLFGTFFLLMFLSVPVSFSIGIATVATIALAMPFDNTLFVTAQKMITALDSFALLALPFFILAGNIMNRGGIAMRLINLALVLAGRLPGALAHCNVIANMLFGSISGSAVASAAAVGGTMNEMQRKAGYDPGYSAAVNIASCPTGLLIPPSNTFIVYSTISGGTSVAAGTALALTKSGQAGNNFAGGASASVNLIDKHVKALAENNAVTGKSAAEKADVARQRGQQAGRLLVEARRRCFVLLLVLRRCHAAARHVWKVRHFSAPRARSQCGAPARLDRGQAA